LKLLVGNEEIIELLEKVRLSHLSGLIESYDTNYGQEWNKLLSPGEQQRLVFARILYWKPRFAVLDEATSAMDKETEEHLYQSLIDQGTTIISVSHHPNLVRFHNTIVHLDGQGQYTIEGEGTENHSLIAV
jgi:ATP-binding cassette subfamily D (ALD) protein 4